jgi:spore coat polysaccharide biosynthesis protein SpsF (cytidylyltransferase family)
MDGVLVFARLDSRRLPGKVLLDIGGRPMLGHVIARAKRIEGAALVAVATSDRGADDPIAALTEREGVRVFRGALDDVAGRGLAAARAFGLERFARVCADRPFFDPDLATTLLARHRRERLDLATTLFPRTWPPGLTTEIVGTAALARALERTDDPEDREHVTRYFYAHADEFRIGNAAPPADDLSDLRLVVDDAADLDRARWIADGLADAPAAALADIVRRARSWPGAAASRSPATAREARP